MAFRLKGRRALSSGLLCVVAALAGCAEGAAVSKEPFEGVVDNGSVTEPDAGASAGEVTDINPGGGSGAAGTNGAATGGGNSASERDASGADVGDLADAGPGPGGDAAVGAEDASTNACLPGTSPCGDLCVDLSSSAANCGSCGRACPGGQACSGTGTCLAPAGCTLASFGPHDYFVCSAGKNWEDARTACKGWGLDLAVIETAEENAFLKNYGPSWIAYNDIEVEGGWVWVTLGAGNTGPTAPFANWKSDEPNNNRDCNFLGICSGPGEDCGQLYADGTWNDAKCDNSLGFLCETY